VADKKIVDKLPTNFEIGDVISDSRTTPYSGSPITKIEKGAFGGITTRVHFENGEVVDFKNGFLHPIEE
jgi:hypothetical protein